MSFPEPVPRRRLAQCEQGKRELDKLSSEVDYEMVRFTNDISHRMGRKTIAEYVADPELADHLGDRGRFRAGILDWGAAAAIAAVP